MQNDLLSVYTPFGHALQPPLSLLAVVHIAVSAPNHVHDIVFE